MAWGVTIGHRSLITAYHTISSEVRGLIRRAPHHWGGGLRFSSRPKGPWGSNQQIVHHIAAARCRFTRRLFTSNHDKVTKLLGKVEVPPEPKPEAVEQHEEDDKDHDDRARRATLHAFTLGGTLATAQPQPAELDDVQEEDMQTLGFSNIMALLRRRQHRWKILAKGTLLSVVRTPRPFCLPSPPPVLRPLLPGPGPGYGMWPTSHGSVAYGFVLLRGA